jgi:hypothetical protein
LVSAPLQLSLPRYFFQSSGSHNLFWIDFSKINFAKGKSVKFVPGDDMKNWIFLSIAIVSDVIATSFLKESVGFPRVWPSIIVIVGYVTAFYFLSLVLKTIPVGVVYAI